MFLILYIDIYILLSCRSAWEIMQTETVNSYFSYTGVGNTVCMAVGCCVGIYVCRCVRSTVSALKTAADGDVCAQRGRARAAASCDSPGELYFKCK